MHAILLSFFKGSKTLEESISDISSFFAITEVATIKLIQPFLENEKEFNIEYDGFRFRFPKYILMENIDGQIRLDLDLSQYIIPPPYDFQTKRLSKSRSIILIINTYCVTDCIYCYADKKTKYEALPLARIISLIDEAKEIGINNIDISGGEFFLHRRMANYIKEII
jgi:sulfatase maturation enzyme AslB (radical SAM superfamily)